MVGTAVNLSSIHTKYLQLLYIFLYIVYFLQKRKHMYIQYMIGGSILGANWM